MDELDLLRLQKANKVAEDNTNDDEDEDEESVDFNEEEVLQRCQDFQKDYQERKNNQKQQQPPIPKPRQFISGRPLSEPPKPSVRTRSSSLTLHDKNNDTELEQNKVENIVFPKPILKKSSDDISARAQNEARPILKRKDSESNLIAPGSEVTPVSKVSSSGTTTGGGILKRKSVTDDNSLPTISKQEHVRIRSPSPDLELRPILRSRNSSLGKKYIYILLKRSYLKFHDEKPISASV